MDDKGSSSSDVESMAPTKPSTLRVVLRTTTRIIKQAFPHIVLITVYIGYLVLGAYGFCRLEHQGREDFKAMTNDCAHSLVNKFMKVSQSNLSNERMEKMLSDELESFVINVTRPEWKESRMQSHMIGRDFNFTSSFLFAMTTITTIGYGDIVPTTTAGRTFCIIYAMFGIPLTLLCLADIGDLLARLVLWFCKKLGINKCTRRIKVECSRSSPPEDNVRMHEATSHSGNQMGAKHGMKHDHHGMGQSHDDQGNSHHHQQPEHHHHHNKGICTKDGTCQEEDVPIFVILVILASYICGMSALMSHIEHWTFGEAVYFTIITVTTIGFGDLVPTELYTHDAFMFCTFFTLLGMAMMSMTITLMKDKVVRLVKYLYHKIKLDH